MRRFFIVLVLAPSLAGATQITGQGDIGIWTLFNNLSDQAGVQTDDSYGDSYISDRYSLLHIGLGIDALDLTEGNSPTTWNAHFRGRSLIKVMSDEYTLGVPNQSRQELRELSLEAKNITSSTDVWVGRQQMFQAGGVQVDGLRGIFHLREDLDLALFGGLGSDPRNLTGAIVSEYRESPFTTDFQTTGVYTSFRGERFRSDGAVTSEFFKGKLDRVFLYAQAAYYLNPSWSFAGSLRQDIMGVRGLRYGELSITARPSARVTNTLSFYRYSSYVFEESDVSAIPATNVSNDKLVNDEDVSTESYNVGKIHSMVRVFSRNYVFGAFEFARRTFDDLNRYKYTAGYRDPSLFGTPTDLRVQLDLIDNFRGFNAVLDGLIGRDFSGGTFRLEGGGTYFGNEREIFENNEPSGVRQADKEFSLRAAGFYNPSSKITWTLTYASHFEVDATNDDQSVRTDELYLGTTFRF